MNINDKIQSGRQKFRKHAQELQASAKRQKATDPAFWAFKTANLFLLFYLFLVTIHYVRFYFYEIESRIAYNVGLDVAAMAVMLVLYFTYSLDSTPADKSKYAFFQMITLVFFGLFLENMAWYLGIVNFNRYFAFWCGFLDYAIYPILSATRWFYQMSLLDEGVELFRKYDNWVWTGMILDLGLVLFLTLTGKLFGLRESGQLYVIDETLVVIYPAIVLILMIWVCLRVHMSIQKRFSLLICNIAPTWGYWLTQAPGEERVDYVFVMTGCSLLLLYGAVQLERSQQLMVKKAEIAELNKNLAEKDRELLEKTTNIMFSQIQPHFIYNSLNTISGLCEEDPLLARDVTDQFAAYLRQNLQCMTKEQMIPFERELEHTKTYLWIEQQRFGRYLKVDFSKIEELDFELPALTLQPIVENAVKHGICQSERGGTVRISTSRRDEEICIVIRDDGVGFSMEEMRKETDKNGHRSVGMENVRTRLQLLCDGRLEIQSEPGQGTVVEIVLPQKGADAE